MMKRKALSTVVGGVFFVIVMASTITYAGYSMDLIGNLAESVEVKQDQSLNRQNEEFKITNVEIVNNEFNLTVKNTGSIPINITKMWAQNMTDSTWNQTKYQLNQLLSPGKSISDIGTGTGLVVLNSSSYNVKLVTERGNALNTQILSPSDKALEMTLFTNPNTPLDDNDVNLLFSVKNNLTDGTIIQSLVPEINVTGTAVATIQGNITPASVEGLHPGETAFFESTYHISGTETQAITFNATVANAIKGNYVTDTSTIVIASVAQQTVVGGTATAVGSLAINFTSFQACEPGPTLPAKDDCRSNSSDWVDAIDVNTVTEYLWRIDITNGGDEPLILEKNSALLFMNAKIDGGSDPTRAYFIRANSTLADEDPGLYDENYPNIMPVGGITTLYFGTKQVDSCCDITETNSNEAVTSSQILIFGYEDINDSGDVDGPDLPYSQNMPFKAYKVS